MFLCSKNVIFVCNFFFVRRNCFLFCIKRITLKKKLNDIMTTIINFWKMTVKINYLKKITFNKKKIFFNFHSFYWKIFDKIKNTLFLTIIDFLMNCDFIAT